MALLLRADEIEPLLDLSKAILLTEEVLSEHANGSVDTHAPFHLIVEDGGAFRVVSGALLETKTMGVRVGPAMGLAPPSGSDGHMAVIYDTRGDLLSIMGYPFGILRTGATVAVAAKYLAREDAKRVGMIGTGRNALSLMRGVAAVRPVTEMFVCSRDPERRRIFCEQASEDLGIPVHSVNEVQQVVSGMDIVMTASNMRETLIPPELFEKGQHYSSMGPIQEVDRQTFLKADHVVVSSREYEINYYDPRPPFPLVTLIEEGKMSWDDIPELGDVVSGRAKISHGPTDLTVFHESAGGMGDIRFASWAYQEAKRLGLGQEITL